MGIFSKLSLKPLNIQWFSWLFIIKAFQKQVERDNNGVCPLYRPKGFQAEARRNKKALSKVSWYRPHQSVLFIPPTPDSELKHQLQEVADKVETDSGLKVRIVERAGARLQHLLPGKMSQQPCIEPKCFLHSSGGKGNHQVEGVVYRGDCVTCLERGPSSAPDANGTIKPVEHRKPGTKAAYIGETARCILIRGEQHMNAIAEPETHEENAFARHSSEYHAGEEPSFKLSIACSHPRPLERQIWEGVLIRRGEKELNILMNSKLDHHAPAVGKVVIRNSAGDF